MHREASDPRWRQGTGHGRAQPHGWRSCSRRCASSSSTDDAIGVLSRALGLLRWCSATKRQGRPARASSTSGARPRTWCSRTGRIDMCQKIDLDHGRFRQIIRGKIKQNLRKYISQGEMIARKGKDTVSIPLPQIDIPRFKHGDKQQGGVGPGRRRGRRRARAGGEDAAGRTGRGRRSPGRAPARGRGHARGARRDPGRGAASCRASSPRAPRRSSRRRTATPASARPGPSRCATSGAPSAGAARARSSMGTYDPKNPIIVPIREDKRYRSWKQRAAAAVQRGHHLHDGRVGLDGRRAEGDRPHRVASGSIPGCARSTRASRAATSSTTRWPRRSIATRSSSTRESGGTMISLGVQAVREDDRRRVPARPSGTSTRSTSPTATTGRSTTRVTCVELLKNEILPFVNLFCTARSSRPTARASSSRTCTSTSTRTSSVVTSRDQGQGRDHGLDQGVPGQGQVDAP